LFADSFVLFAAALYSHRKPARGFTFFAAIPKQIHKIESLLKKQQQQAFSRCRCFYSYPQCNFFQLSKVRFTIV